MWIAALILLALALVLQLRIRLLFLYREGGPRLRLGLGLLHLQVYPMKKRKRGRGPLRKTISAIFGKERKKKRSRRAEKEREETELQDRSLGEQLDMLRAFLPLVWELTGRLRRKLLIRELTLQLNWGADDPADAAIGYGRAHAVMGALLPLLEANFRVKQRDARINLDYSLEKPNVYLRAQCSISLMQALSLGIFASRKALGIYLQAKRAGKPNIRKAVQPNGASD